MKIKTNKDYLLGVVSEEVGNKVEKLLRDEITGITIEMPDAQKVIFAIEEVAKKLNREEMNALYFVLGCYFQRNSMSNQMEQYVSGNLKEPTTLN